MMNKKIFRMGLVGLSAVTLLAACGNGNDSGDSNSGGDSDTKVAFLTDQGGVDDRSFNQSRWEGL